MNNTHIQKKKKKKKKKHTHTPTIVLALAVLLALPACTAAWKTPEPLGQVPFMERAETQTRDGLTVTVAVPDREETERIFGTNLYKERIQPVWVEIHNETNVPWLLLPNGMAADPYSPLEASYQRHSGSKETRRDMDVFFYSMGYRNPALPGRVTAGFVFTDLDEGFKAVNVDLVAKERLESFTFVVKVPGLVTDADQVDFERLFEQQDDIEDETELIARLEALACCTTNRDGDRNGDPVNVVFIGDRRHIFSALIRRGWHQTEITYAASAWKTVKSFLFGSGYRYSPISPLYLLERPQDLSLQKARDSIHLRNHMRIWVAPFLFRGMDVYFVQISRDIGVKFNWRTVTTHAIDPLVDDARDGLVADLAYSQAVSAFGLVKGSQVSTLRNTHYNLTLDPYYSDGLRAVIFFDERPRALDKIEVLDWESNRVMQLLQSDVE